MLYFFLTLSIWYFCNSSATNPTVSSAYLSIPWSFHQSWILRQIRVVFSHYLFSIDLVRCNMSHSRSSSCWRVIGCSDSSIGYKESSITGPSANGNPFQTWIFRIYHAVLCEMSLCDKNNINTMFHDYNLTSDSCIKINTVCLDLFFKMFIAK